MADPARFEPAIFWLFLSYKEVMPAPTQLRIQDQGCNCVPYFVRASKACGIVWSRLSFHLVRWLSLGYRPGCDWEHGTRMGKSHYTFTAESSNRSSAL